MKKVGYIFLTIFFVNSGFSQTCEFRIGIAKGNNAIFMERIPSAFKMGKSSVFSTSFIVKNRKSKFYFESSLVRSVNNYKSKSDDFISITYSQQSWGLFLQSGIALSELVVFKSGVFIQRCDEGNKQNISVVEEKGYRYLSLSNSGIQESYYPTSIQAGIVMGLTLYGSKSKRVGLDIQLQQYGAKIMEADYALPTMKTKKLISKESLPMVFLVGLNYKIQKYKKRSSDEEAIITIIW